MKHINGKMTIGAPFSKARYENANFICADCLEHLDKQDFSKEIHYKALTLPDCPAVCMNGHCYVCEEHFDRVAMVTTGDSFKSILNQTY